MAKIREQIEPLITYIKQDVFHGCKIMSQELVVNNERGVLALCDLSSESAVLEIKTNNGDPERYKEQLFYEAAGRRCYILGMNWNYDKKRVKLKSVDFCIFEVDVRIGEKPDKRALAAAKRVEKAKEMWQERLKPFGVEVKEYNGEKSPLVARCTNCGHEWSIRCNHLRNGKTRCPKCYPEMAVKGRGRPRQNDVEAIKKKPMTPEERLARRAARYAEKISERSNGRILVKIKDYSGSKESVRAECLVCGNVWESRADRLLLKCECPDCGSGIGF